MNARGWVGEGFRSAKNNLKIVGLFWLIGVPFQLSNFAKPQAAGVAFGLLFALLIVALLVVNFILWIGLIHYLKLRKEGSAATLGTLWGGGLAYFWRIAGQTILLWILFAVIGLLSMAPFLLTVIAPGVVFLQVLSVLLAILIFSVGLYFILLASAFAGIILITRSERIVVAIKQSFFFTRRRLWIITRMGILFFLIFVGVAILAGILSFLLSTFGMGGKMNENLLGLLVSLPATFISLASTSAFVYFYLTESAEEGVQAASAGPGPTPGQMPPPLAD